MRLYSSTGRDARSKFWLSAGGGRLADCGRRLAIMAQPPLTVDLTAISRGCRRPGSPLFKARQAVVPQTFIKISTFPVLVCRNRQTISRSFTARLSSGA